VQFTVSGATFTNTGTVTGGNGGAAGALGVNGTAGTAGLGGVGIVGSCLTIINSGTISGGTGGSLRHLEAEEDCQPCQRSAQRRHSPRQPAAHREEARK